MGNRFKQVGAGGSQGFTHRDATCSPEGELRTVDTVIGAIDERHHHVHYRAAEWSLSHRVLNPRLYGRDVLSGDHSPGDLVREFEPRAARQRSDLDEHVTILPMPSGLLLVPAALGHGIADRFPHRNGRRASRDIQSVAPFQPGKRQREVFVVHPFEQCLASRFIGFPGEPAIFLNKLVECG